MFLRMPYTSYKYSLFATSLGVLGGFGIGGGIILAFMHQWADMVIAIILGIVLYIVHYKYGDSLNKKAFERRLCWDAELCEEIVKKQPYKRNSLMAINKEFKDKMYQDLKKEIEKTKAPN